MFLALFPLWLPVLVVGVLWLCCIFIIYEPRRVWLVREFRAKLRNAGRISSWAEVESALASGSGTLIVDMPSPGWNDTDVWWMPESISALAASDGIKLPTGTFDSPDRAEINIRTENPVFDRWCQTRFFDTSSGTAKLVQSTRLLRHQRQTFARIRKLNAAFPKLETATSYTLMVLMADLEQRSDSTRASEPPQ